ncbi:MAG: DUF2937 family protein [Rhodobacteraceae bacterium]|nr:DUF2937 family protein [Paracoccaceae bacterium]
MARIFMVLLALVTGSAGSQFPEFAQQYRQRIGGAIDALQEVMTDFQADASRFGLSVDEAIARLKASDDGLVQKRGYTIERTQDRLVRLIDQREAFQSAGPFARLVIFLESMDPKLARSTVEDFEPAIPVTSEGIVTAGLGAGAGLLGFKFLAGLGRLRRRRTQQQIS